jgi:hypothetical protein
MNLKLLSAFLIFTLFLAGCASNLGAPQPVPPTNEPESTSGLAVAPQTETGSGESGAISQASLSYPIVDTGQITCYDNDSVIPCPETDADFYGQDGSYGGFAASYRANGDGTVSDLVTGLTWTQSPDLSGDSSINATDKLTYDDALAYAETLNLAGHSDWRVPTIKELYSLIDFNGYTGVGDQNMSSVPANAVPYINTDYFEFGYGDTSAGERYIDAQFATSTKYVSTTMNGAQTMFGVNFADGRIKGYGLSDPRGKEKGFYVLFVRGSSNYGVNDFVDNGNGTITDNATGLTWVQSDSGAFGGGTYGDGSLNWQEALNFCESLEAGGASDWRLPDIKELHSLVDYTRSPDTTNSAAIDPLFDVTYLPNGVNNSGQANYPHTWSSTTHLDGIVAEARAAYIAFGEARGVMNGTLMDVHGAGAQRSDLKSGDPASLPAGFGPQGDVQSTYNFVRCVRGGAGAVTSGYTGTGTSGMQGGQPAQEQPSASQGQQQPGRPQGGLPPQEAIDACLTSTQGAACSFSAPNGTVSGTCGTPPNASQLICMPANRP